MSDQAPNGGGARALQRHEMTAAHPAASWREIAPAVILLEPALAIIGEFLDNFPTSDHAGVFMALNEIGHAVHRAMVVLAEVQDQIRTASNEPSHSVAIPVPETLPNEKSAHRSLASSNRIGGDQMTAAKSNMAAALRPAIRAHVDAAHRSAGGSTNVV